MNFDNKKYPLLAGLVTDPTFVESETKAKKEVDISQVYRDIGDFYKSNPDRRAELGPLLIELAEKMGLKIPFKDPRDMYLIADEQGKLAGSAPSWNSADKIRSANPGYKIFNRTHPSCPPELKAEFNKQTGWD